jgi:hypothetical protein
MVRTLRRLEDKRHTSDSHGGKLEPRKGRHRYKCDGNKMKVLDPEPENNIGALPSVNNSLQEPIFLSSCRDQNESSPQETHCTVSCSCDWM